MSKIAKVIPVRFDGYMEPGGSTLPWRVITIPVDVDFPSETPYVAKLFSESNILQGNNIGKEFIGNFLATQFELTVPESKLIDLHDDAFYGTLAQHERDVLSKKFNGPTYCSKLITAVVANRAVQTIQIQDSANIFAFDCLICNVDRGGYHNKPNLLLHNREVILIDHELILNFIDDETDVALDKILELFTQNSWPNFYTKHYFYNTLRSYKGTKKHLFDTFEELLRTLDITAVISLLDDLTVAGVSIGKRDSLITYLRILKQDAQKFCNILLSLIS